MLEILRQLDEGGAGGEAGASMTETNTEKISIGGENVNIPANLLDAEDSTDPGKKAGQSGKSAEAQSKYSDGFLQTVSGKSPEELIEMLHKTQETIGKQSFTIGPLKKGTEPGIVPAQIKRLIFS